MTSPAATCSLHNLPLATCCLAVATCHLPFATRHLQFDFNFKLKLFPGKKEKRETREGLSPINWQSMWAAHYIRIDLLFHLQAATPPLPYSFDHSFPSFQPAAGPARHGQLNVHFHVHRRHCEVTINCKHFHFCQWSARGTVGRNCCKKYAPNS